MGFSVFGALVAGCGDGQITGAPRSSAGTLPDVNEPGAGEVDVDEPAPGVTDGTLEPENTRGDSWETMYEACTGDDYPAGYRPPTFIRPTRQNTGANCPDPSCPTTTTLRPYTGPNPITSAHDGMTFENFYIDNGQRLEIINAHDVTIRNFEIRCTQDQGHGVYVDNEGPGDNSDNIIIEYGTFKKGSGYCSRFIQTGHTSGNVRIRHIWFDQYIDDGLQSANQRGPVMFERSLVTRAGANGAQSAIFGTVHSDVWQFRVPAAPVSACMLGVRVVPVYKTNITNSYEDGCYRQGNITQNGTEAPGKWYIYNNWLDGGASYIVATDGLVVRNNKWGHFFQYGLWTGQSVDLGDNVWECDGSPVTDRTKYEGNCLWGWDRWLGEHRDEWPPLCTNVGGDGSDRYCRAGGEDCYPSFDAAPIDPTEFGWPPPP